LNCVVGTLNYVVRTALLELRFYALYRARSASGIRNAPTGGGGKNSKKARNFKRDNELKVKLDS